MKKKYKQCYFLGAIIMLLVSCLCSFVFVKGNLMKAASKSCFESIYLNTNIDYIVPPPSDSQIDDLENTEGNGIRAVTPYYETTTTININGKPVNETAIIFPFVGKMQNTPYCPARITHGSKELQCNDAIVDQTCVDRYGCAIGDTVSISIVDKEYTFRISSISEANTFCNNGTIALILTEDEARQFSEAGIRYSAAYISADNKDACKAYLYSVYKPLSRLKDRSKFDSEDVYNQHLQNFNEADWSKEITNCLENYSALGVKYQNIQMSIWTNIIVMAIIVAIVFVVFNAVLLTNRDIKIFMKILLIKKNGTKDTVKTFYKSGIIANLIVFCIAFTTLFVFLAMQAHVSLLDLQAVNCIVPILTAIVVSVIMIRVSCRYVENHYKIRVIKKKDLKERVLVKVT